MSTSASRSVVALSAATAFSFAAGVGLATYMLRLRDRERLRHACSRTSKKLARLGQRAAALGSLPYEDNKDDTKYKVVVIGAGSYGTAMAYTAAINGHEVVMFMRDAQQCECINVHGYNPKYLSNYKLNTQPSGIHNTHRIRGICQKADLKTELSVSNSANKNVVVILALPCQKTPDWIREHSDLIPPHILLCSTAKGLYLPTKQLIGHAILDALNSTESDARPQEQPLAFLSGPSFAEEIVKGYPTAVVVASDQLYLAVRMQRILSNKHSFRVYTSQDPIGVQLAGALKNPLAVGAGMIAGMGFGTNTLSACVTRASRELCDLCIAMGGNPRTIDGLSGIGDLMLTCFSSQSRNQRCGQRLIRGESVADIEKDYTVEGVATADVAVAYADMCGLELPLFRVVYDLIHKHIDPQDAVPYLMGRPLLQETSRAHMAYTSLS